MLAETACTGCRGGRDDQGSDGCGDDRYHQFATAPMPSRDMDPKAVAFHEKASTAVREILFKGAERVRKTL